ncbi:MAG: YfhO family protein, partial [candidate division KSB1 bacterium]|nr:YfhO family protein [candidate division KSB1 bacterium]
IILNYVLLGFLTYFLLKSLNLNRYACLFSAIAVTFLPQFIAFTAFGHNTKFYSVVLIPLIFWSVKQLLEKKNLFYFAITALVIGFQLLRAHIQVCYYTYLMIGIYFIFQAILEYKENRKPLPILKSGALLAAAVLAGLMLSSVLYLSVYEYSHYSIRGGGITEGLDYKYASNWSFSPAEMITFIVPSFFGFGGETYWGKMPFTDYPLYMGIVVLFLAGLALVIRRDRYVIFFAIVALFALIVSFGSHLPILYGPMFKFLPYFNKFRVPSMIHIILDIAVVIMAGFGLHFLIQLKDSTDPKLLARKTQAIQRYFYVFGGVAILIMLFVILGKGTILNWIAGSGKVGNASAQQFAYQMTLRDSVIMLIILGASGFLVLYYLNKKLNTGLMAIGIIFLLIVDLWLVDFKIIKPQPEVEEQDYFQKDDVVRFLENQPKPFRILPVNIGQRGEKPDNWYMYFKIQNILGYHAAKLKIYQEALEQMQWQRVPFPASFFFNFYQQRINEKGQSVIQQRSEEEIPWDLFHRHQAFLRMLNVKYLITMFPISNESYQLVEQANALVYENKSALPRAFFVGDIVTLKDKNEIFGYMASGRFDPARTAILEEKAEFEISPNPENEVQITHYDIHDIKMKASVKSPALLVLSEVYYPAGWKAYVDGEETKIYKTNYILRSIFLQPGDHNIEFVFRPASFKIGLMVSIITLMVLIALLVYSIRHGVRK